MKKQNSSKFIPPALQRPELASQKGFTLVELSIVLVIIGLIIGGILKGQELIGNAEIKNVIAQSQGYQSSVVAFRDKYGTLPGDLVDPQNFIPNCTAAPCKPGSGTQGDGLVGETVAATYNTNVSADAENVAFWQQLAAARFIGDIDTDGTSAAIFGSQFPSATTGGGFHVLYQAATGRHSLRLSALPTTVAGTAGALRPDQALQVDRVIDDGRPGTGSVFTNSTISGATCFAGTVTAPYLASNNNRTCNLVIELN